MDPQLFSNPHRAGTFPVGGLLVRSDRRWKDLVSGYDVPEDVRKSQFDWLDDSENSDGFFKHHGTWYHLSQFMRVPPESELQMDGWDGYEADSFSTGTVVKVSRDGEQYKVGTYRVAPR